MMIKATEFDIDLDRASSFRVSVCGQQMDGGIIALLSPSIILHTAIHFSLSYILLFTFHYLTYYSSLPIILHILHTTIAFHYLTYPQICIHIGALKKCLQLKIPSIKNADKIKVGVVDRSRSYC